MTKRELRKLVREVLDEDSGTGAVGGYNTPFAFSKKGQGINRGTQEAEKLGYKLAPRPKHPSHTKMFDYLEEKKEK